MTHQHRNSLQLEGQMRVLKAQSMKHGKKFHSKRKRNLTPQDSEHTTIPQALRNTPPVMFRYHTSKTTKGSMPSPIHNKNTIIQGTKEPSVNMHTYTLTKRRVDCVTPESRLSSSIDDSKIHLLKHSQTPCILCGSTNHSMIEICHRTNSIQYTCPIASFNNVTHSIPSKLNLNYSIDLDMLIDQHSNNYWEMNQILETYFSHGSGKEYSFNEQNDIRKRVFRIWSNREVKRMADNQDEIIKDLTLPFCRSCGSKEHGLLTCRMGSNGRLVGQYFCPFALCSEWNEIPNQQAPYGYKWLPCPSKVTKSLKFNISEINKFCDTYETTGFGKHLSDKGINTLRKDCHLLCEDHFNIMRGKELVQTTVISLFCIMLIWATHFTLGPSHTN